MNFMERLRIKQEQDRLIRRYKHNMEIRMKYNAIREKLIGYYSDLDNIIDDVVDLPAHIRAEQEMHKRIHSDNDVIELYKRLEAIC